MSDARIPLLYILSNGRSGSTLLDLLLHAQRGLWSLGEAQILPWELRNPRAPCGCGAPLADCAFWRGVLSDEPLHDAPFPIEYFRESHGRGRVLRREHLGDLWRGRVGSSRRENARAYGAENRRVLSAVREHAARERGERIDWLIDASKDPYRLAWLAASDAFDLRVVHLVKDPRAFVHSMTRGEERGWPSRLARAVRFAARWNVENALFQRLGRAFGPDRWHRLRYEDLAAGPAGALGALGAWLGRDFELPGTDDDDAFRAVTNHCVSGNRMRWRSDGIRLDESWRRSLPGAQAAAVWGLTWPVRTSLGYRS